MHRLKNWLEAALKMCIWCLNQQKTSENLQSYVDFCFVIIARMYEQYILEFEYLPDEIILYLKN